ncbi:MAG TPA: AmmeMemoRadiSam system protein A [Candidatus Acidoferrum sp.]|nr:AmmeMemoRadiSam system protein A [Candidatus Acidoferrum sp.]
MQCLSETDQQALLELAGKAIREAVLQRKIPDAIPRDGIFSERRGVFVTILVRGRLQGCIGVTEPSESLGEAIVRCAVSAALEDPRFAPMKEPQLGEMSVEISLLSPLEPILPEAIEIGRHGLLVVNHAHRGLLLPKVATEHRLTREQFLEETCRKAGLPRDAWKDPETELFGFTCEVFSDTPASGKP